MGHPEDSLKVMLAALLVFCPDSYTWEGYMLDREEQETRKKLAKGKKKNRGTGLRGEESQRRESWRDASISAMGQVHMIGLMVLSKVFCFKGICQSVCFPFNKKPSIT